jgi:signal transduction histidine kinase
MCAGLAAGATGLSAIHLGTYFAFLNPLALPLAIRFFMHPDWIHQVMAIFVLIYVAVMSMLAATTNRMTREAARLRFRLASTNEALAQRADELRRAEQRVHLAMDAGNLAVFHCDAPFEKVVFSAGAYRHLGIPAGTEVTFEQYYRFVHPNDRDRVRQVFERCIREGLDGDLEFRTVRPTDGRIRWIRVIGCCLRDRDAKPHRFDGVTYDITHKKQEEEERERLLRELSDANLLLERLLGIVGHDLKSPLTAVAMAAHVLHSQVADDAATKNVDRILRSAERMKGLIGQLLDFARSRAMGGISVDIKPVDLHALCHHVIDELAAAHPRNPISLETNGDGRGMWDGDRLLQVLSNLLGNAVQHGGGGSISVRVDDEGENLVIAVHNQGQPIPPDVLPLIFDPFQQGEKFGGQSQSIGLGLYIVQQIVLAHLGQIDVKSPDGDGTTFTVRLPRHPTVRDASQDRAVASRLEAESPSNSTTPH